MKIINTTIVLLALYGLMTKQMPAQKNCATPPSGLIPLTDIDPATTFRGFQGGLYPGGNQRPVAHGAQALAQARQIRPLDTAGRPDDAAGSVVMIGVGASNPRTEFQRFTERADTMTGRNPALRIVNTCIGGQGIQKMNQPTDNYWKQALNTLQAQGLSAQQVQVAWIETDNTQNPDTAFPQAPQALMADYRTLLGTIRTVFPNVKLCYLTARAYSGYVDPSYGATVGRGLLHPRDYYNGWAIKWLIENQINDLPGYQYNGPGAVMPFITWGGYLWADGATPRHDGLSWICQTDLGDDGLHLTAEGELKSGGILFDTFLRDTTAAYWLRNAATGAASVESGTATGDRLALQAFPNPFSGQTNLTFTLSTPQHVTLAVYDVMGRLVAQPAQAQMEPGTHTIPFAPPAGQPGVYAVGLTTGAGTQTILVQWLRP